MFLTTKSIPARIGSLCGKRAGKLAGAFMLALLVAGCASTGDPHARPTDQETMFQGPVAIVASERIPQFEFTNPTACQREFPTADAGPGTKILHGCLGVFRGGSCQGVVCGGLVILFGICGAIAATVGIAGIAIDLATSPEPNARFGSLAVPTLQESVRKSVEDGAAVAGIPLVSLPLATVGPAIKSGDYRQFGAATSAVHVVETTLTGASVLQSSRIKLEAQARVINTRSNDEVYVRSYTYQGNIQNCWDWHLEREKTLLREAQAGLAAIGPMIYEDVFERFPLTESPSKNLLEQPGVGLAPINPPDSAPKGYQSAGDADNAVIANDALGFQWESFPRATDLKVHPQLENARNVRYELLIAQDDGTGKAPGEIIYQNQDLPKASHIVDAPLRKNTRYYWTVRARFELDGRRRVTDWGAHRNSDEYLNVPNSFSYRFNTRS